MFGENTKFLKNALLDPRPRNAASAAPSRRNEPFRTARGYILPPATIGIMMEVTLGHHGATLILVAAELRADITQVPE